MNGMLQAKRIVGVIPARYASSRYPGKPLADILGYPMIWWVYQQAKKVAELNQLFVATEDKRIEQVCKDLGMNVLMTKDTHPTGTDRVGEVAEKVDADVYINIQGDEPLIESETIRAAIKPFEKANTYEVTNLATIIEDPTDLINFTVPKVVTNDQGEAIFLSRSPIPYPKGKVEIKYLKQVCVYGFTKNALRLFCSKTKGNIEQAEDIELLRFIENGMKVKIEEVHTESVAVDTPKDLERVKKIIEVKVKKSNS